MTASDRTPPPSRTAFRHFRTLGTRWDDNDVYGHMNNTVHYRLFDTAINGWLMEKGLLDFRNGEIIGLVVETTCRYFAEAAFPDTVHAGIAVERLGTSSVTYRIGLFRNDEQAAFAEGRFTHVHVGRESRRPVALPDAWRVIMKEIVA